MAIEFTCSKCGKKLRAKDELAGKRGKCPKCQTPFTVPQQEVFEMEPVIDDEEEMQAVMSAGEPEHKREEQAPKRKLPSAALIKRAVITGAIMGVIVVTVISVVDYFLGGRSKDSPGLLAMVISSAIMGVVLGAIIGAVMVFTESLPACIGASAALLAVLKIIVFYIMGLRGTGFAVLAGISGAIGGAIVGYLIASSTAESLAASEE